MAFFAVGYAIFAIGPDQPYLLGAAFGLAGLGTGCAQTRGRNGRSLTQVQPVIARGAVARLGAGEIRVRAAIDAALPEATPEK